MARSAPPVRWVEKRKPKERYVEKCGAPEYLFVSVSRAEPSCMLCSFVWGKFLCIRVFTIRRTLMRGREYPATLSLLTCRGFRHKTVPGEVITPPVLLSNLVQRVRFQEVD